MSFKVIAEAEGRLAGLDGGSREGEKEGEDMVANLLKRVQSLGSQGEEGKQKFREILKEAEASQNSYTKGLITQARKLAVWVTRCDWDHLILTNLKQGEACDGNSKLGI